MMRRRTPARFAGRLSLCACACIALAALLALGTGSVCADAVRLRQVKPDPFGAPRPYINQTGVPLRTGFYVEMIVNDQDDSLLPESTTMTLESPGLSPLPVLLAGQKFQPGFSGELKGYNEIFSYRKKILILNVNSTTELLPSREYTVHLSARTANGAEFAKGAGSWRFTTEAAPTTHTLAFSLDARATSVTWEGGFFTGFCKPSFCTSEPFKRLPEYEMMRQVQQRWSPKAWSLQRDWWITGFEYGPAGYIPTYQPNVVRERETRRITTITLTSDGVRLFVEDFFGHEQYGIPSGRPLSPDYHRGDIVLVADGVNASTTTISSVDDATSSVIVDALPTPEKGWKTEYAGPLPTKEVPGAPGWFAPGGCYLRKFSPSGTPHYYWGRVDYEEDVVHGEYGRRLVVNFCDGPGDLSIDGMSFTTCKDYAEMHEVARQIAGHLIDRYGAATLQFLWSIGNECDSKAFWRVDSWAEFQKYYDYTVDGILRAFEDRGLDSAQVKVGGLEFARVGSWRGNPRYHAFLAHASPQGTYGKGESLELNQAFADPRLDGKRSGRIEKLCSANAGKGTPLDFVSVHTYVGSFTAADDMIWAKQEALAMDADYFAKLSVGTHESCPQWAPPPDNAAHDSYLGDGFFGVWCADVARRLLDRASGDPRYRFGESILTFTSWVPSNLYGMDDVTQMIPVDDNGDGVKDRDVAIGLPELHLLGMIASMGNNFWPFPEVNYGGHIVSGFAARTPNDLRILLYAQQPLDPQSRSDTAFDLRVMARNLGWTHARVEEYRIDKAHNSIFALAEKLKGKSLFGPNDIAQLEKASQMRVTRHTNLRASGGNLAIPATMAGNGISFLIVTPE